MSSIGESELILNPRGSVYHLDLLPNEIATTIITVGDLDRVSEVSKYFDRVELRRQKREFVTHTGFVGNKRISVISTGIGPDNIDIVLNELDALFNIDFETRRVKDHITKLRFIRVGTSGALQPDIQVDSFVLSETAIGMDNLMNFYNLPHPPVEKEMLLAFLDHVEGNHIAFIPYVAGCAAALLSHFDAHLTKGITVTCPGFYGPQGRTLRGSLAFPNLIDHLGSFSFSGYRITNFEMETSAIYGLSRLLGHDALSLSAIVANRIEKKFSTDPRKAVDKLIRFALEKIVEM
jgi:uridine phosphorylase